MGQNQCYHFGVGAPPILVYFSGDWAFVPWPCACFPSSCTTRQFVFSTRSALGHRYNPCIRSKSPKAEPSFRRLQPCLYSPRLTTLTCDRLAGKSKGSLQTQSRANHLFNMCNIPLRLPFGSPGAPRTGFPKNMVARPSCALHVTTLLPGPRIMSVQRSPYARVRAPARLACFALHYCTSSLEHED